MSNKNISSSNSSPGRRRQRRLCGGHVGQRPLSLRVRYPIRPYASETVHVPQRDPFDVCGHDRVSALQRLMQPPMGGLLPHFCGSRTMRCACSLTP